MVAKSVTFEVFFLKRWPNHLINPRDTLFHITILLAIPQNQKLVGISETAKLSLDASRQVQARHPWAPFSSIPFLRRKPWVALPRAPLQTRLITCKRPFQTGG